MTSYSCVRASSSPSRPSPATSTAWPAAVRPTCSERCRRVESSMTRILKGEQPSERGGRPVSDWAFNLRMSVRKHSLLGCECRPTTAPAEDRAALLSCGLQRAERTARAVRKAGRGMELRAHLRTLLLIVVGTTSSAAAEDARQPATWCRARRPSARNGARPRCSSRPASCAVPTRTNGA